MPQPRGDLVVGAPGVAVIDNKAWNGRITVDGDRLKVGGYSKPPVLASLADAATAVAQAAATGRQFLSTCDPAPAERLGAPRAAPRAWRSPSRQTASAHRVGEPSPIDPTTR